MLSLALLCAKSKEVVIEASIKWFRMMLGKYPGSYQLRMGYANILSNKSFYEEGLEEYQKVADAKPKWVRPL